MKDILKAMEYEKIYLNHRMRNETPFQIIEKIKECGFNSLEQYNKYKNVHLFEAMNFELHECAQEEIISEAVRILTNKLTGIWQADSTTTCVFNGFSGDNSFNMRYCEENDIPVFSLGSNGGTIIHQNGDFSWGICYPTSLNIRSDYLLNKLKCILQKHTLKEVIVDGNDILVDGKKVCGSTVYEKNDTFLFISYFSFNDKSELIKNICNKISKKIPGYIDFITCEEFKKEVCKWLQAQ